AGVRFHHQQGASGRRYMVEIAGGGVVVFDYDDDGRPDLYFVNGAPLPGDHDPWKGNALFRNLGDGRFADVTQPAKLQGSGYGMGGAAADADNDGDIDLLVTSFGRNLFFKNNGDGTFTDATDASGIDDETWSASAAFSDLDRDGFVDLYVTNYLDFTLETHRECVSPQREIPSYCHPQEYDGVMDRVYRNERNGVFADVTLSAGAAVSELGKGLGVVASDYDGDGDADLYVANDTTRNFLFQNQGDGTFHEVGLEAGVAYNEEGLPEAGMGTDWGDVDRDGLTDLIVTNFDFETNTLYRNLGSGFFLDATAASGLGHVSLTELGFGCDLADFDNDGWLDFVVTNGHILDNIAELQANLTFAQPAQFFRNEGGRFREESEHTGEALSRPRVGRGLATLDFDGDGDLDLVLSNNGGAAELLENEGGNRNPSLSLRLLGTISNRDGIGARVRGEGVLEELRAGSSYLSQNELVIHLGLGDATDVRGLVLRWPSGAEYDLPTLDAGRRYVVKEGAGVIGKY
ncbi:MAG TPA: CRTAC1 family protein, partial [Vicinamibacteria bacterium]|nr:CRTAC1 family protein [Vicinamibacteria bacterium]